MVLRDWVRDAAWLETVEERTAQTGWVLDHLDDLDADFLAVYGIDLDHHDLSARRYFALAHRLTAYTGVMAARAEAEREDQQPTRTTSTRTSSTPAPARDGETSEVSLTAFRMQFPGLVSMGGGAGGG